MEFLEIIGECMVDGKKQYFLNNFCCSESICVVSSLIEYLEVPQLNFGNHRGEWGRWGKTEFP